MQNQAFSGQSVWSELSSWDTLPFWSLHFVCMCSFLSYITEIFGCMVLVDYVLQLSGVSLCLLLLNCFSSELLLGVVALARLKSRRAECKYKQWKVICEADICGIVILFLHWSFILWNVYFRKEAFIQRWRSASAWYCCLLLWGRVHLGTPAELVGDFLWINVLCSLARIGDCSKHRNTLN